MADFESLGALLRSARASRSLSLRDTARMAGISAGYLSDLENGKKDDPSVRVLARVAFALGMRLRFGVVPRGGGSVEAPTDG